MAQTKAQVAAAAAAAKERATAANAAALNAKIKGLDMLRGRVDYKKGTTKVKPVSYEALSQQLELGQGLMETAVKESTSAQAAQLAADNYKQEINKDTQDAYALLEEAFRLYGLESLVPVIRGYMEDDLGPEQAKLKLKSEKAYKDRFKGNELRVSKGLNVIDEASYLELENDYSETLRAYGLGDYFGTATDATTRLARQQKMADVIGNDISASEFKERISTVVTRVTNSDSNTRAALKAFYDITDTDLVKYFLDPKEGSVQLKEKVTIAEISGASMTQGLGQTSLGTAQELARLGIDKAEALAGYSTIAGILPTATKLSDIYNEAGIKYTKAEGEAEVFKGSQDAITKRARLASMERGSFSGSAGRLSSQNKTAGLI
jgi:hypothetical protein